MNNFSENISNKLTEVMTADLNYGENKKEIIAYAIEMVILNVLGILLLIVLGFVFNVLMPSAIAGIFGVSLRKVSGGAHFDTPSKCLIIGSIIYVLIGILAKKLVVYGLINQHILMTILLVSILTVAFLAPVDSKAKPIHSRKLRFKLKISSIVFVGILFLIIPFADNKLVSVSAVLGISYQGITLLPIFNKMRG